MKTNVLISVICFNKCILCFEIRLVAQGTSARLIVPLRGSCVVGVKCYFVSVVSLYTKILDEQIINVICSCRYEAYMHIHIWTGKLMLS